MKYNITIFITFFTMLLLASCNSTKFVPQNKLLLTENIIELNGKNRSDNKLTPFIIQRPNSKISLWLYGLGDKNYEEKWRERVLSYSEPSHFFTKVLSLKQTIGYANFRKDINKGLFKNGEAPMLLDTVKTRKTRNNLNLYYMYEGYFKNKIDFKVDTVGMKKATVSFKITTGKPFYIDSIKHQIASPIIDSLHKLHKRDSYIKEGQQFKRSNFEKEAERLTAIFRNAGVFHFSKQSINFREVDSTNVNYKTNVLVDIVNRVKQEKDSLVSYPYQIYTLQQVNVITDYSFSKRNNQFLDSIQYQGINFYAFNKINYTPRLLALSIFLKSGQKYSDINSNRTRQHLQDLAGFRSIRIKYEDVGNKQLIATIFLTPNQQYSVKLETELTHSNLKPYAVSGKLSYKNNNTFKRNEIFQLGLQGSFINVAGHELSPFFNAWELGFDTSYKIPRLLIPFYKNNSFLRKFTPKTIFTIGTSLQKNIGLDKQRFTTITEYNWNTNTKTSHTFELLNAQFIRNLNVGSFFKIYPSEFKKLKAIHLNNPETLTDALTNESDALGFLNNALTNTDFKQDNELDYLNIKNIKKRYSIITEDVLVPTISYQLIYNTQSSFRDTDYSYIRTRLASSGLLTSSLSSNTNQDNIKQIFGINIAQYVKLDLEYRKHWDLGSNSIFALRTSLGLALPYGNSNAIPFSRSYFAGGPNDIRAWKIYELGPGGEDSGLDFNVGNFKILTNFEYRFDILNSYKGALFIDAGNIWDNTNTDLTSEKARFKGFQSLENIAIGSGFGLRYDFSFVVARIDLGFKIYEPYKKPGNKWLQSSSLKKPVFNLGINYPF